MHSFPPLMKAVILDREAELQARGDRSRAVRAARLQARAASPGRSADVRREPSRRPLYARVFRSAAP